MYTSPALFEGSALHPATVMRVERAPATRAANGTQSGFSDGLPFCKSLDDRRWVPQRHRLSGSRCDSTSQCSSERRPTMLWSWVSLNDVSDGKAYAPASKVSSWIMKRDVPKHCQGGLRALTGGQPWAGQTVDQACRMLVRFSLLRVSGDRWRSWYGPRTTADF